MLDIEVNYPKIDASIGDDGFIRDVAGVNGSPVSVMPGFPDLEDQLNQLGIVHFRMHDFFGAGDIDNGADPTRATNSNQLALNVPPSDFSKAKTFVANYSNLRAIFPNAALGMQRNDLKLALKDANYAITDKYLARILSNNAQYNPTGMQREIMFRIGRSNDGGYEPPENFDIYASLVEKLVERYSANLALSNIPCKVAYWEIWNEPDLPFFWNSDSQTRYYRFYEKIARSIKKIDPSAKVGGPGVANGFNTDGVYMGDFIRYCQTNRVPLDFFSWHYYGHVTSDPQNIIDAAQMVESSLKDHGFSNTESLCTEWNSTPFASKNVFTKVQSARNAAYVASTLIYMQSCKVDRAHYYRGDALSFGLFNDNPNPAKPQYRSFTTYTGQAFALFNQLKNTPHLLTTTDTNKTGISVLAGKNDKTINIIVSNYRLDPTFTKAETPPEGGILYRQHYVDCGRTVAQIDDDWCIQNYFAGKRPNTLYTNNIVRQNPLSSQIDYDDALPARERDYKESQAGTEISLRALPFTVLSVKARRIVEGGDLSGALPPETSSVNYKNSGPNCVISDPDAKEFTVTLYTIELSDVVPPPPPPPEPTPCPTPEPDSFTYLPPPATLMFKNYDAEYIVLPEPYYPTDEDIDSNSFSFTRRITVGSIERYGLLQLSLNMQGVEVFDPQIEVVGLDCKRISYENNMLISGYWLELQQIFTLNVQAMSKGNPVEVLFQGRLRYTHPSKKPELRPTCLVRKRIGAPLPLGSWPDGHRNS